MSKIGTSSQVPSALSCTVPNDSESLILFSAPCLNCLASGVSRWSPTFPGRNSVQDTDRKKEYETQWRKVPVRIRRILLCFWISETDVMRLIAEVCRVALFLSLAPSLSQYSKKTTASEQDQQHDALLGNIEKADVWESRAWASEMITATPWRKGFFIFRHQIPAHRAEPGAARHC